MNVYENMLTLKLERENVLLWIRCYSLPTTKVTSTERHDVAFHWQGSITLSSGYRYQDTNTTMHPFNLHRFPQKLQGVSNLNIYWMK